MNKESSEYLQQISQGLFNLISIISAYKKSPIIPDKKLHKYFNKEKEKLTNLLTKQVVKIPLSNSSINSLPASFLLSDGEENFAKKQIEDNLEYLTTSLDVVQSKREYKSSPTTGLENGELKDYIQDFLIRKKTGKSESLSNEPIVKEAGFLNLRKSGNICFKDKVINMRTNLKTLCEVFIDRPNQLINRNDIADEIGVKSSSLKSTIAKYVSELNKILEPYFERKPIMNDKKEGWIFIP